LRAVYTVRELAALSALKLSDAHRLSYWDSLVVASAVEAGCERLLSEDFQHEQKIGDLVIINPSP
jgi:predicted nucleic acid-binding protein